MNNAKPAHSNAPTDMPAPNTPQPGCSRGFVLSLSLIAAIVVVSASCYWEYTPPNKWQGIRRGMTKANVEALLGSPSVSNQEKGIEIWIARRLFGSWRLELAYRQQIVEICGIRHVWKASAGVLP